MKYFEEFQIGETARTGARTVTEYKNKGEVGGVVSFDSRIKNRKDADAAVYQLKIVMSHRPAV